MFATCFDLSSPPLAIARNTSTEAPLVAEHDGQEVRAAEAPVPNGKRDAWCGSGEIEFQRAVDVARPCLVDGRVATLRRELTNVYAELLLELR